MLDFLTIYFPEFFYVLCSFVSFDTAYRATRNKKARVGTTLLAQSCKPAFVLSRFVLENTIKHIKNVQNKKGKIACFNFITTHLKPFINHSS